VVQVTSVASGIWSTPQAQRSLVLLEYTDQPGDVTTPHQHPDSVMYTLSSFRRRLVSGDVGREVELAAGLVNWLPAQLHHGENIGDTATHVIFVELKGAAAGSTNGFAACAIGSLSREVATPLAWPTWSRSAGGRPIL